MVRVVSPDRVVYTLDDVWKLSRHWCKDFTHRDADRNHLVGNLYIFHFQIVLVSSRRAFDSIQTTRFPLKVGR